MRPLDALLPKPEQRLMRVVLAHPDREFGTLELLAQMGNSRSAGSVVLKRWVESGVLRERRVGNQRRIAANKEFVLFPELRRITQKTVGLAEPLAGALKPVASRLIAAFVFGSVAAGNDTSQSDIDVALVGDVDLFEVSPLVDQAERVLGRPVHVNVYGCAEWTAEVNAALRAIKSGPRIDLMQALQDASVTTLQGIR